VGIYSAAYAIGTLPLAIISILGLVLPPALSRLYDEGKIEELRIHLSYSLKYSLLLVIPFVFGGAFLAKPVLRLFSTPEIASEGYIVLVILLINSLVVVVGGVISQILIPLKKTKLIGLSGQSQPS
jgi:O-antigen/teichoic acid export membrane protein